MESVKQKEVVIDAGSILEDILKESFSKEELEPISAYILRETDKPELTKEQKHRLLHSILKLVLIQADSGDLEAQRIINDIKKLAKKGNSQSAANTPATV